MTIAPISYFQEIFANISLKQRNMSAVAEIWLKLLPYHLMPKGKQ